MGYLWVALAGGALASAHCLGMCGGFALHFARGGGGWGLWQRQLLWHAGKTFTYVFLGALAGFLGAVFGSSALTAQIQNLLSFALGFIIILMGFALLGLRPIKVKTPSSPERRGIFAPLLREFFSQPTAGGAFFTGLATGFLPCPIIYGFLALAASSASVLTGMCVMAAVGLGTVWSLLLLGLTGNMLGLRLRRWGTLMGGIVLILMGLATTLRGTEVFHRVLGCPASIGQTSKPREQAVCPHHSQQNANPSQSATKPQASVHPENNETK